MKNENLWKPSKFVPTPRGWQPSPDPNQVGIGSRFITVIQIKEYEKLIRNYAQGNLLDLGCGSVPLYGIYKELISSITCVDWEETSHNGKYLDYEMDLNKKLSLKTGQFDTVILTDVLEHIFNPLGLLKEVRRVLKKDGKLILAVPFFYWLHEIPHDYHRYTKYALEKYCQEAGLEIVETYPYGGLAETILDITAKMFRFSRLVSRAHLWLAKRILSTFRTGKISAAELFPLGYVLVAKKND